MCFRQKKHQFGAYLVTLTFWIQALAGSEVTAKSSLLWPVSAFLIDFPTHETSASSLRTWSPTSCKGVSFWRFSLAPARHSEVMSSLRDSFKD